MHKFLWNVKLWLTGITILVMMPFVFLWALLVEGPIELTKRFMSERND
jgi:hypothetical protein